MPSMSATSRRRRSVRRTSPMTGLLDWTPPQLTKLTETVPEGDQWAHEIKLDGYRMHGRLDHRRVKLLTRTGLDWADKYPTMVKALRPSALNKRTSTASFALLTRGCPRSCVSVPVVTTI
jgi:ATP-dependent DNA ligase